MIRMTHVFDLHRLFRVAALMALCLAATPSFASLVSHAFATRHLVIQISNGTMAEQKLVLNNAANVLNYLGPDKVQIEIVAFGPGLRLLLKNNINAARVRSLHAQGVEFAACHNTMKAAHITKAMLNPVARVVPAGMVEIMRRESEGWNYIRP